MATLNFASPGRPEPLQISIKKVGDNSERFISRNGNTAEFNAASGDGAAYVMQITDAAGQVTTAEFTTSCQRPPDCQEGPDFRELISFDRTGLTYRFHGVNVQKIRREILNNGVIVDISIDEPTSEIVTTQFKAPLANGTYQIRISGESCYSGENATGREFIITDDDSALAWSTGYPRFDYDTASEKFRILVSITKAGSYPYEIKDAANNVEVSGNVYLAPGQIEFWTQFDPDTYHITLGTLSATLVIDEAPAECEEGPILLSVTSNSQTQTTFNFDGLGVFVIEWFIRNLSDVIEDFGTKEPGGPVVTINHKALSGGSHNLLIKGSSCTSQTGIVDNLDFNVNVGVLTLGAINVSQQADGRYKLETNFSGGSPNYIVTVRTQGNNVIGVFPNTTGSPANVTLPAGTIPQTVKVSVTDSNNSIVENTNVVLPAPSPTLNFLQRDGYIFQPQKTPMNSDGVTYFIGAPDQFNWDVEFNLPNGGLWDYIEKRVRKQVSGNWVEKSVSAATGQSQNYSVASTAGSVTMWNPRNGNQILIDGVNVFKTAGTWEFKFIARKGGPGGAIVGQKTIVFTISAPPTSSGITLYNRSTSAIGSAIGVVNSVGGSYPKPVPRYDLSVSGFDGVQFDSINAYFRQKVNNEYVARYTRSKSFGELKTSLTPAEFSLFDSANFASVHVSILAQEAQSWQIEFVAYAGGNVVGSRKAEFNFTLGETEFSNPGMERKTIAGRDYVMTNGMDFGATALPSGNMKLYHPANRPSINGQSTCYPWVYYNHVRMDSADLADFRSGSGLAFPEGIHTISIKWHSNAVANYDDVIDGGAAGNAYNLAGEQLQNSGKYSAMDDYFTFSIID